MKKLALLLCSIVFMGALATQAACPCKTEIAADPPCCETPVPCCETPKPCCSAPDENIVKQDSCCWGMTQVELFNRLCLSQCQMEKACCLYNKYRYDAADIKDRLTCAKNKLCLMLKGCATPCEIKCQQKKIRDIKNDLEEKWDCYEDQLKGILTKQQLKCYKKINKEENSKYKKLMKNKCCCKQS